MKDNLTPEQRACIQEATQALERLRDLMPVEDTQEDTQEDTRELANLTPEDVFMIVTCNGQREMTLQRFKDALIRLNPPPPPQSIHRRCSRCGGAVYSQVDAVCKFCIAKIFEPKPKQPDYFKTCAVCKHASAGATFCMMYNKQIDRELGPDCEQFLP